MNKAICKRAVRYALDAYGQDIKGAIKIESRRTSTTAFIIKGKASTVVVFRGSQQYRDWVYNVFAVPWRYKGRWAHAGFIRAHKSVWDEIREHLDPEVPTIFTGHSLGGALAELSAHRCRDFKEARLITFGKPNVFLRPSRADMKFLQSQVSFVCGSDLIARIPKLGYAPDAGQTLVYFDNWGHTLIDPPHNYVRRDFELGDSVADHSMVGYKERVDRFCST